MIFTWLKRYVPRGLYGRAALILLLPIITLQVVVSVVFIQRHFEDVTQQMTRNLVLDLNLLQREINTSGSQGIAANRLANLAVPLELNAEFSADPGQANDRRWFYDLSGKVVIQTLKGQIANLSGVNLRDNDRQVTLWMGSDYGVVTVSLSRRRVSASNPHQFLVLMVFVGLVMTFVAFVFLRNQLRPIKLLARAAEAFGRGRIEDYRPAGALEVRSAGRAFLDMRARIERHIEQRTMMLSGVSHDLRTPLTRFKLGLSLMDNDVDLTELNRDIADMERLLDAFLTFAKDDALDDPEPTDPVASVREITAKFSKGGASVSVGVTSGTGLAMLRPMALERAVENLIGNGLRYAKNVRVSVAITSKSVKISVEDDGPGVPAELWGEAVKPFVRLDAARNQDGGSGVGLGLAIAHDTARRHGGTLRLSDSSDLGGLRVDIVMPR